jgi:hypothetical protein
VMWCAEEDGWRGTGVVVVCWVAVSAVFKVSCELEWWVVEMVSVVTSVVRVVHHRLRRRRVERRKRLGAGCFDVNRYITTILLKVGLM